MANIIFILGGARSGKSSYAEKLALENPHRKIYLATAEAQDTEMHDRISVHQQRRGKDWATLEIPIDIADVITASEHQDAVILVDCLTLWISNLMHREADIAAYSEKLLGALQKTKAHVLLVSNEVGQGIVPDNALARQFRDHAGMLHQQVAAVADHVVFMIAGIPTIIKGA